MLASILIRNLPTSPNQLIMYQNHQGVYCITNIWNFCCRQFHVRIVTYVDVDTSCSLSFLTQLSVEIHLIWPLRITDIKIICTNVPMIMAASIEPFTTYTAELWPWKAYTKPRKCGANKTRPTSIIKWYQDRSTIRKFQIVKIIHNHADIRGGTLQWSVAAEP